MGTDGGFCLSFRAQQRGSCLWSLGVACLYQWTWQSSLHYYLPVFLFLCPHSTVIAVCRLQNIINLQIMSTFIYIFQIYNLCLIFVKINRFMDRCEKQSLLNGESAKQKTKISVMETLVERIFSIVRCKKFSIFCRCLINNHWSNTESSFPRLRARYSWNNSLWFGLLFFPVTPLSLVA